MKHFTRSPGVVGQHQRMNAALQMQMIRSEATSRQTMLMT
jgi:hypothetical protein